LPTEADAQARLGVSRGACCEATRILTAKNMIVCRPRSGIVVLPRAQWTLLDPDVLAWHFEGTPSRQFIADLFELRRIIEPARMRWRRAASAESSRIDVALVETLT
jgi:GntR family transcriptional regulator, galactonate operon transcriptional repressor